MLIKYTATLRNGQLNWGDQGIPPLAPDKDLPVTVTILAEKPLDEMADGEFLNYLGSMGGLVNNRDVLAWHEEHRDQRQLPPYETL